MSFPTIGDTVKGTECENILMDFCLPSVKSDVTSIKERYEEITQKETAISIVPAENKILQNIIWPIKHAKVSYCLENYLGTIALCGMAAEMLAILIFEVHNIQVSSYPINKSKDIQKGLFGNTFEKLGQERRVNILFAYGVIDDKDKSIFSLVRKTRNKYLHLYSDNHLSIKSDALKLYASITLLFRNIIGLEIRNGAVKLNSSFVIYFRKVGIITEPTE